MLPVFLIEETTVRESGESAVFDATKHLNQNLLLTFGITHAVENQSIGIEIHGSADGMNWPSKPIAGFTPKYYCGTYQLVVHPREAAYIKAVWRVSRWSRDKSRPFFRFYLFAQPAMARVAVVGAA